MSDDLVKFLRTEAEEAAKQASRDWDEEDEKRIAFAVLRDKLYEAANRITALEAENKRLREALEPFAGKYRPEQDWSDDLKIAGTPFQYGDFRRAAAALEKK